MNLKSMLRSKSPQHPELHKRAHALGDAIMQIAYPSDDHMGHWARFVPTITIACDAEYADAAQRYMPAPRRSFAIAVQILVGDSDLVLSLLANGDTYPRRETLKSRGWKWDGLKWAFPIQADATADEIVAVARAEYNALTGNEK